MAEPVKMIEVIPHDGRITVTINTTLVADSRNGVILAEYGHDPVCYIPMSDIRMELMEKSAKETLCPHKGIASYWSYRNGSETIADVAWCYETPISTLSAIAGKLGFYPDKVDAITMTET